MGSMAKPITPSDREPAHEFAFSYAPDRTLRHATTPLLAGYLTFGLYWGVWVVVFADYLRVHGLTEGEAGIQMSVLAVVSILTMVFLSPRMQTLPLATAIAVALGTIGVGAVLIGNGAGAALLLGFVILGVGNGLIDVFMNVAAQGLEVRHRRPVLQWLHASYAVGGICGALGSGIATTAGVSFRAIIAGAGILLFATMTWNYLSSHVRSLPRPAQADTRMSLSVFKRSRRSSKGSPWRRSARSSGLPSRASARCTPRPSSPSRARSWTPPKPTSCYPHWASQIWLHKSAHPESFGPHVAERLRGLRVDA